MSAAANFRYTVARCTVHSITVGMGDHVDIVGDPENAAYEWLIRSPQGVRCHSDVAYGSPEAALRDGLSAYLGEAGAPVCPVCRPREGDGVALEHGSGGLQ